MAEISSIIFLNTTHFRHIFCVAIHALNLIIAQFCVVRVFLLYISKKIVYRVGSCNENQKIENCNFLNNSWKSKEDLRDSFDLQYI